MHILEPSEIDKLIGKIFNREMNGELLTGTAHPINFFARGNINNTEDFDACWDVISETWVKLPVLTPDTFDPEAVFPEVWKKAEALAKEWDIEIGELKRDIRDYDEYKDVLDERMQPYIEKKLTHKIKEITSECKALVSEYDDLHALRRAVFSTNKQMAREAWMQSRNWADENILWKIMERWQYLSLLAALKKIWDEGDGDTAVTETVRFMSGMNSTPKTE